MDLAGQSRKHRKLAVEQNRALARARQARAGAGFRVRCPMRDARCPTPDAQCPTPRPPYNSSASDFALVRNTVNPSVVAASYVLARISLARFRLADVPDRNSVAASS